MENLQLDQICLKVGADGSICWLEENNVFQFSNETTGLLIYTPYDALSLSALINIRLPDRTVLPEDAMTFEGTQEIKGITYYLWSYNFQNLITSITGYSVSSPITVSFRFVDVPTGKSKTTAQVFIPIQPSLQGSEMVIDPSTADTLNAKIDNVSALAHNNEQRIEALENVMVRKVLIDFTVDDQTGEGIKYYSDGTTATVQFPTGGGGSEVKTEWIKVLNFTAESFSLDDDGTYSTAFGSAQTGFIDSNYLALMDKADSKIYEAGTETEASERQGYSQLADTFFKGSDGSILIYGIAQPFSGRLVLLGGSVFSGMFVTNVTYDPNAYTLTIVYINGSTNVIQLPRPTEAQRYIGTYTASDWTGDAAPYTLAIPEAIHTKGANPSWRFYDNQIFDVDVDADGNMTIYTTTKKDLKIIII